MVLRGHAGDALLDSYETERRDHIRAMITLSTWVGRLVSITNRPVAAVRNVIFRALSAVPRAKAYIVQMRFRRRAADEVGSLLRQPS